MKKLFWKNQMASEDVGSLLIHGRFYDATNKPAEIFDGAVVTVGALEDHALYAGVKDLNVRKIQFAANDTDAVAVVDIATRSHGEIMGVDYREGIKTAGLTEIANVPVRVRLLNKIDSFTIGTGNVADETIAEGDILVPEAGTGLWTKYTAPDEGEEEAPKTMLRVEDIKTLTEGVVDTEQKYLCTVINVVA